MPITKWLKYKAQMDFHGGFVLIVLTVAKRVQMCESMLKEFTLIYHIHVAFVILFLNLIQILVLTIIKYMQILYTVE